MAAKARRRGSLTKTVSNHLTFAHGLFSSAVRRARATNNPRAVVDRPASRPRTPTSDYLVPEELELCSAPCRTTHSVRPSAPLSDRGDDRPPPGRTRRIAWRDVDWAAGVDPRPSQPHHAARLGNAEVAVVGAAVPMADRLAASSTGTSRPRGAARRRPRLLPPVLGTVLDRRAVRKRFGTRSSALADLRRVSFHDLRTPSARGWRRPELRFGRSRNGWATGDRTTTEVYADYAPDPTAGSCACRSRVLGPTGPIRVPI